MKKSTKNKKYIYIISGVAITLIGFGHLHSNTDPYQAHQQVMAVEARVVEQHPTQQQQTTGLAQTLKHHASGKSVVLLQRILAHAKMYPEKRVTGYYGDTTKKAVMKFQQQHNLTPSGVVDQETQDTLNKRVLPQMCPEQTVMYPDFTGKDMAIEGAELPKNYTPPSLEKIPSEVSTIRHTCLQSSVILPLIAMSNGAKKDGVHITVSAGYRSYGTQQHLHKYWADMYGEETPNRFAKPGKSEHQLGVAIDITVATSSTNNEKVEKNRKATDTAREWLLQNAHKYGFVMSKQKSKKKKEVDTGEPWHWRFIGTQAATEIHNKKTTMHKHLEERSRHLPVSKKGKSKGVTLPAEAVLSLFIGADGTEHTLVEKNKNTAMPIASVTKLMTALIATELFQSDDLILITKQAVRKKGASGYYQTGDVVLFNNALHALLIDSHNEIASSIAESVGTTLFIKKMNEKAQDMGLHGTNFGNPTGLDPVINKEVANYATATDVAKLLQYIFENKKEIFEILEKSKYSFSRVGETEEITIETTNKLLENQETQWRVLGGKTGTTPKAKMNLATITNVPTGGYAITVVLRAEDSFNETREIVRYIKDAYEWTRVDR